MSNEASLAALAETLKRADPDRYVSALFAPAEKRPLLVALYAFNLALARVSDTVKEPMAGDIRFAWWRETLEEAREGLPRALDEARGLAEMFAHADLPVAHFEAMIAARARDLEPQPFADTDALEAYVDATSGNVMRLAAMILDDEPLDEALLRHAGLAYGLVGVLRAAPAHAARGKSHLPSREMESDGRERVIATIVERARSYYRDARARVQLKRGFSAILPAALVPLYAKSIAAEGVREVPLFRRQWTMLRAAMRGRI